MARRSIVETGRAIVETFAISIPTFFDAMRGRVTREACDRRLASWAERVTSQAEISLEVRGYDRVPAGEAFVVMSNHQSHYDIPVLYRSFPRSLRMVAKKELFRVPVFAAAMRSAEMIEIDRHDSARARESLLRARERIASGLNVWIAPEGTRSQTGDVGPFKRGGFILALETGTRILPVSISGTRDVLPRGAAAVAKGQRVVVTFHDPVDPARYGVEGRRALIAEVRAAIVSA